MNKTNIKYWKEDNTMYAEWADRSLDDEDRYEEDSIIITVDVDVEGLDDNLAEKKVNTEMQKAYNKWIKDTRG